jgi:hypothetical protein
MGLEDGICRDADAVVFVDNQILLPLSISSLFVGCAV